MVTTAEYLAQIARETEANERAVAEGFESAAHKEMYANYQRKQDDPNALEAAEYERQANIRAAQVTDPRTGQPFASASDMEAYANDEAVRAGFTSAVDQEIDANRRAREAGYLNAADYESGLRTRSDAPFFDPRDLPAPVIPPQFAYGTANEYTWDPVTGKPTYVGTGIGPGVGKLISQQPYTQTAPLNWQYILPTQSYSPEFSALALNPGNWQPWATGQSTPSGLINYQIPGGDAANVTYTGGNPNLFNTNTDGTTFSGGTNTDAQGNKWIMSNGQWIRADSDLGSILSSGGDMIYPFDQYDSSGAYSGAEGFEPIGKTPATFTGPNKKTGPTVYGVNPAGTVGWGPTETHGILGTMSIEDAMNALNGN